MDLSEVDQFEINSYFKIDERIQKIKDHIARLRASFYNQTLVSHTEFNEQGVISVGFQIEKNVIPFIDVLLSKEQGIERLLKKKRYLNDYLNSLDPEEKKYLIDKYSSNGFQGNVKQSDLNLYAEIIEINEAINFMYGFPVDAPEERPINNEKLEDDFNEISAMLGV